MNIKKKGKLYLDPSFYTKFDFKCDGNAMAVGSSDHLQGHLLLHVPH
jgi:hypothetical protein